MTYGFGKEVVVAEEVVAGDQGDAGDLVLTVVEEVEAAINPYSVVFDGLVFLRVDWPFSGLWEWFVHLDVLQYHRRGHFVMTSGQGSFAIGSTAKIAVTGCVFEMQHSK